MIAADIFILLLFAVIPVYRLIRTLRHTENKPGALAASGIILSIVLGLSLAGVLMAFSMFY